MPLHSVVQVLMLPMQIDSWEFDIFQLSNLTDGRPLYTLCMTLMEREGLLVPTLPCNCHAAAFCFTCCIAKYTKMLSATKTLLYQWHTYSRGAPQQVPSLEWEQERLAAIACHVVVQHMDTLPPCSTSTPVSSTQTQQMQPGISRSATTCDTQLSLQKSTSLDAVTVKATHALGTHKCQILQQT